MRLNSSSPGPPGPRTDCQRSHGGHERRSRAADAQRREIGIRKISIRLVPFVALMFFINYLDRTAIGFAAPSGMNADLGLSAAQSGFASGIFFLGYIVLEVPSNLALQQVRGPALAGPDHDPLGHRPVLSTFVQTFTQLTTLRFLLGVAEAGFFPARSSSSACSSRPATAAASSVSSTWPSPSRRSSAPPWPAGSSARTGSSAWRAGGSCSSASVCRPSSSASSRGSTSPTARRRPSGSTTTRRSG